MTEYRSQDGSLEEVAEAALHGIEGGVSLLGRLTVLGTAFPPQIPPPFNPQTPPTYPVPDPTGPVARR
jgi:hypothetical protein